MKGILSLFLLGLVPIGGAGGLLYWLYRLAGSAELFGKWIGLGLVGALGLAIFVFFTTLLGAKLWYGSLDHEVEGRGGLSKVVVGVKAKRVQKKEAALAAAKQDGQLSEAVDARGRLSTAK